MIFKVQTSVKRDLFVAGGEESVPAVTLPASAMASSQTDRKINLEKCFQILVISLALNWAIAA